MKKVNFIEFLIIRHGQSTADIENLYEGRADFPLTDLGMEQARLAAKWIADNYPPQKILSSPLQRAKSTAEEISRRIGVPVEYEDDLQERNNGILAGKLKSQIEPKVYLPHETVEGGESLIDHRARVETVWSKLLSQSKVGQRVLIVSHGGTLDMLFQCFLGMPLHSPVRFKTGDTGIHCWRVGENQRTIVFTNQRTHLETCE